MAGLNDLPYWDHRNLPRKAYMTRWQMFREDIRLWIQRLLYGR
jgi:hypothetical protein